MKWLCRNLQPQVAALPGAPYIVGLGVRRAGTASEEAREIINVLAAEIRERIPLPPGQPVKWRPGATVNEYVSEISLERPGEPDFSGFSPEYADAMRRVIEESLERSPWKAEDTKVIVSDFQAQRDPVCERAVIALERKKARYSSGKGLVLLIHYRVTSYDEEDLPEIVRAVQAAGADFKEVWIVSDWSMEGGLAHCVWTPQRANLRRRPCYAQ